MAIWEGSAMHGKMSAAISVAAAQTMPAATDKKSLQKTPFYLDTIDSRHRFFVQDEAMPAAGDYELLLARAIDGDRRAMTELLLWHGEELSAHIAARLPTPSHPLLNVDDLLQETFVRAMRGIRSFQPRGGGSFLAWLKTVAEHEVSAAIATRMAKKRSGRLRRRTTAPLPVSGSMMNLLDAISDRKDTPGRMAMRHEAVRAVHVGLAELPESQRQAVRLVDLAGKSVNETAELMDRSQGAVRGLLYRARRALRAAIGQSSRWFETK